MPSGDTSLWIYKGTGLSIVLMQKTFLGKSTKRSVLWLSYLCTPRLVCGVVHEQDLTG